MVSTSGTHQLYQAIHDAKIEIVGYEDIGNEAHAAVVGAIIKAFGNSSAGFIYIEPSQLNGSSRPPDILLCHPEVGVLVIEVKAYSIDFIQGSQAGSLLVRLNGVNRQINPIQQVTAAMFDIKHEVERRLAQTGQNISPLFNAMVAFPNIAESDWVSYGYDQALPGGQMLFGDQFETPKRLKQRIMHLIHGTLKRSGKKSALLPEHMTILKETFGDTAVINERRPPRQNVSAGKLGGYLDDMLAMEKHLSREQQTLSRIEVGGHPRLVRGVAGSGKTVVLANMVARYVKRARQRTQKMFDEESNEVRVAVICFNRALVSFIGQKIGAAYQQQTMTELPEGAVRVTHLNGLMYTMKEDGLVDYIRVTSSQPVEERATAYREQIAKRTAEDPNGVASVQFDAIFVDEGQDLVAEEYLLLLDLIRPDERTGEKALVIFYDDAQNLYARPRPNWSQLGIDVQRGDRSRVMKECFRNPREVIELAFNVLLGVQSPDDVQVRNRTYADVNYLKQNKLIEELGDHFRIRFAERSARKPFVKSFATREDEIAWIAKEVKRLIHDEQVRPEDMLILFESEREFRTLQDAILTAVGQDNLAGFIMPHGRRKDRDSYIFCPDHITISTTRGAKGYDAQVVFLIGVDTFDLDEANRSSFYVGATRTKLALYVTGVTQEHHTLLQEAILVNQVI
ncbi:MAG: DUF2075 domain-containing protein [Anaerolineaceae bacterium]|nr:MAG: DUF2075 domain-containing protein [Anaerolineaceae bacterium]